MTLTVKNKLILTEYGTPFLWGETDQYNTGTSIRTLSGTLDAGDRFGTSVAIGNGKIVVGAPYDNTRGSIYIYDINGLGEIQRGLTGSTYDLFGWSVAVGSGRIVAGSPGYNTNTGRVYVYRIDGTLVANFIANDTVQGDSFGNSVAAGLGKIVIGAPNHDSAGTSAGAAYLFSLDGTQLKKITGNDTTANDKFGSVISVGSGRIVVGAYGSESNKGAVYIFDSNGNQIKKITASDGVAGDEFGSDVSIGCGLIVVGAQNAGADGFGAAYIFDINGNQIKILKPGDLHKSYGNAVAVGSGRIIVGAPTTGIETITIYAGRFYVYNLKGELLRNYYTGAVNRRVGSSVAVKDGRFVVGAPYDYPYEGFAFLYSTPLIYTPYDVADIISYGQ